MEKFFKCNSFSVKDFEIKDSFIINQQQLTPVEHLTLKPSQVPYHCEWHAGDIDPRNPFVIVPIRDNSKLLQYTLENFKKNNFFDYVNVIIVDDRSEENLQDITKSYPTSFLKTKNEIGFNFSMLNNIASLLSYKLGGKSVIFWNSDLWIDKIEYFLEFLKLHKAEKATISGSKLLYPYESLHDGHSTNILKHFPQKTDGSYKGTVQFGGSRWFPSVVKTKAGNLNIPLPYHFRRFSNKDDSRVNSNYGTDFVTGALQLVNLNWFIKIGGFNPSLPKVFQDVDLCLKAIKEGRKVMYFGKDIHFFHDESYNHYSNKNQEKMDLQFHSDQVLFAKIWNSEIGHILS